MVRCLEYIYDGTIASICLISSQDNLSDSMTKHKPNQILFNALQRNKLIASLIRVCMLQRFAYRYLYFIPTISVQIHSDKTLIQFVQFPVHSMLNNLPNFSHLQIPHSTSTTYSTPFLKMHWIHLPTSPNQTIYAIDNSYMIHFPSTSKCAIDTPFCLTNHSNLF